MDSSDGHSMGLKLQNVIPERIKKSLMTENWKIGERIKSCKFGICLLFYIKITYLKNARLQKNISSYYFMLSSFLEIKKLHLHSLQL